MRIGVNVRFLLLGKLEGIGLFTHQILQRVVRAMPQHDFVFFFDRPFDNQYIYAENVTGVVLSPQARHPVLWYLWFEQSIPRALKQHKIDLFISTDGYLSLNTEVPTILTIHDLAFHHYKEHLPFLVHKYFNYYTPKFAQQAKHIITVSQFSKEDIIKQYTIKSEKISVVGNGCDQVVQPLHENQKIAIREKYTEGKDYFVYIGAIHPRKNIKGLLAAFEQLKEQHQSEAKLVLVGRWAWKNSETQKVFRAMKHAKDVISLGHLERTELGEVLGASMALVYPSFFEGFGIPLLEAMYAEVPVITSNRSSLPEVAGNAAIIVNPDKVEEIAAAMYKIESDSAIVDDLVMKGKIQREKFTWEKSAVQFIEVLDKFVEY